MLVLKKPGQAGTVESNDILIAVAPGEAGTGVTINLTSPVEKQFGAQIRTVIGETLAACGVADAVVTANDRGALDCTVRARVETAVARGAE
ncbi:MAG TPA: citrate lyase acyl carrier protein [Patescibacteria group bacterium]|nr:citrate lyase acyl carrier protein [Patescibacteria group bacterium]